MKDETRMDKLPEEVRAYYEQINHNILYSAVTDVKTVVYNGEQLDIWCKFDDGSWSLHTSDSVVI